MVVGDVEIGTDVLVIGGGPAGYSTAVSCARNGLDVTFAYGDIGGDPMLYAGYLLDSLKRYGKYNPGHAFDITLGRRLKDAEWMLSRCKEAGIQVLKGKCSFVSSSKAVVSDTNGRQQVEFKRAVIATGTRYLEKDGLMPAEIVVSKKIPAEAIVRGVRTDAVAISSILSASGGSVTLANSDVLLPDVDADVVKAIIGSLKKNGAFMSDHHAGDKAVTVEAGKVGAAVDGLGIENTGIKLKDGFIEADDGYRTTDPAIYAIGGAAGVLHPGLAYRDGKSLAGIFCARQGLIKPEYVPIIIYSDPPSGSVGISDNVPGFETVTGRTDLKYGFVKVVAEKDTERLLGAHCMCEGAHGLMAEATLALEMGARLDDIVLTVHPYNESFNAFVEACERAKLPGKGPSG